MVTTLYLILTGIVAGGFGALLGIGGGIIVIPVLTILFKMPIHTAIGISLVGVIATSTGAAIRYVREGKADIKLGMLLESGTTIGAVIGAVIAGYIGETILFFLFSAMLIYNAYSMYRKKDVREQDSAVSETKLKHETEDKPDYKIKNIPVGIATSVFAGILSALLGVGGGLIKIPAMYLVMGVPLKVAAATSNFMIGVTASASAFIYYLNGDINPAATVPVALGVFAGAVIGARVNAIISVSSLKKVFVLVFVYVAFQMAMKGIRG